MMMAHLFKATMEDLQAVAFPEVLARGVTYWENGHVRGGFVAGDTISADVMGTMGDYRVRITWDDGRLKGQCDCPYKGSFCKHAAAVVWGWLNEPERFLTADRLIEQIDRLSRAEIRRVFLQLAAQDPQRVLAVLAIQPVAPEQQGVVERLTENMARGEMGSPEWLTAWRRILELLAEAPYDKHQTLWEQLIGYGVDYLQKGDGIPEAFWDYFQQALRVWGRNADLMGDVLPKWWNGFLTLYRQSDDERRRWLAVSLIDALHENNCAELLKILAETVDGDWSLIGIKVGLALRTKADLRPMLNAALHELDHTLALLDACTDWQAWEWLKRLAQNGLRWFSSDNRLLFRERLALAHVKLGEPRQAFVLLLANFRERPGWGEYLELMKVAEAARELERGRKEARSILHKSQRWEILARLLLHEKDGQALAAIAPLLEPVSPCLLEAARYLREDYPGCARELYQSKIRYLIGQGTRRAVREAIPYLAELKRLDREEGWSDLWEAFRRALVDEITDPIALRMTGSLLLDEEKDEKPNMETKGD